MKNNVKIMKNIVYARSDREYLTSDMYLPVEGSDLPIVLLLHGGGFQAGSKEMYQEWGPFLAKHGFAVMAINYRLATPNYATYPGLLDDVQSAIDFLVTKANEWNLDPLRMALMGDSAGGYLTAMTALKAEHACYKIQAAIPVYGVFDMYKIHEHAEKTRTDKIILKFMGTDPYIAPKLYREASPIYLVDRAAENPMFNTQFLVIWGETDEIAIPDDHSKPFVEALQGAGIRVKTLSIPNRGHFWFTFEPGRIDADGLYNYPNTLVTPHVLAFLNDTLLGEVASDPNAAQYEE